EGTRSEAGRRGCQLTCASTRIAVCPLPAPVTSTTSSRTFSTPGIGASENMRSHDGGPKSASPSLNRRGGSARSQARTAVGLAGRSPERDVVHQRGGTEGGNRDLESSGRLQQPLPARRHDKRLQNGGRFGDSTLPWRR